MLMHGRAIQLRLKDEAGARESIKRIQALVSMRATVRDCAHVPCP